MQKTDSLCYYLPFVRQWDWEHIEQNLGAGIPPDSPGLAAFLHDMRQLIDRPGHDIHSVVPLVWRRGDEVKEHSHPEWTVIFYYQLGDPPVPILLESGAVTPLPGDTLILSPGEKHAVPRSMSDTPRIAVAMRINTQ